MSHNTVGYAKLYKTACWSKELTVKIILTTVFPKQF